MDTKRKSLDEIVDTGCALCSPKISEAIEADISKVGDVIFYFKDQQHITVNILDPEPKPQNRMTGTQAKDTYFRIDLYKEARTHYALCRKIFIPVRLGK